MNLLEGFELFISFILALVCFYQRLVLVILEKKKMFYLGFYLNSEFFLLRVFAVGVSC